VAARYDALPGLRRGEILQATLLQPPGTLSSTRLRWQIEEKSACERLQADLDPVVRQRLLTLPLWTATMRLRPSPTSGQRHALCASRLPGLPSLAPSPRRPAAATIWQELLDRLGDEWTLGALLAHLTGEDIRPALQAALIRHLAAHLDHGLAAWRNPARAQGFFMAWRQSASSDWAWELDEFAWRTPRHRATCRRSAAGDRQRTAALVHRRFALQRLSAATGDGIAGLGRHVPLARSARPGSGRSAGQPGRFSRRARGARTPVCRAVCCAVSGACGSAVQLGGYFIDHPPPSWRSGTRPAVGSCRTRCSTRSAAASGAAGEREVKQVWRTGRISARRRGDARTPAPREPTPKRWPPGRCSSWHKARTDGRELRALGPPGHRAMLGCADSLTADQRGLHLAAGLRTPLSATDPGRACSPIMAAHRRWPARPGAVRFLHGRPRGGQSPPSRRSQPGLRDLRCRRFLRHPDALAGSRRRGADRPLSDRRAPDE
jgi:hypothetical protein